ncbi:MAG TPA: hypothetical protein VE733_20940 [Streptosporangiaceae bacterium]|nr:hypothetical protein [Streptosporangiaceae bacterium]
MFPAGWVTQVAALRAAFPGYVVNLSSAAAGCGAHPCRASARAAGPERALQGFGLRRVLGRFETLIDYIP